MLRAQLALLGSGQEDSHLGPAVRYRRFQKIVIIRIDQIAATSESIWVHTAATPAVRELPISDVYGQIISYIEALGRMDGREKLQLRQYIDEVYADSLMADEAKCQQFIQKLVDAGCRDCVKGLIRRRKLELRASAGRRRS